jgi:hypothetical protein
MPHCRFNFASLEKIHLSPLPFLTPWWFIFHSLFLCLFWHKICAFNFMVLIKRQLMRPVNGPSKTSAEKPQGVLWRATSWGAGGAFFINDGVGASGEEFIPYPGQTDVLLPAQYLKVVGKNSRYEPERRLMLAILKEATDSFRRYVVARRSKERRLFREAEEWILEQDSEWLFSFENICETLGLDPGYLRSGLMAWKEKMRARSLSHNLVTSIAFRRQGAILHVARKRKPPEVRCRSGKKDIT